MIDNASLGLERTIQYFKSAADVGVGPCRFPSAKESISGRVFRRGSHENPQRYSNPLIHKMNAFEKVTDLQMRSYEIIKALQFYFPHVASVAFGDLSVSSETTMHARTSERVGKACEFIKYQTYHYRNTVD